MCGDRALPRVEDSLLVDVGGRLFERQTQLKARLERQARELQTLGETLRRWELEAASASPARAKGRRGR